MPDIGLGPVAEPSPTRHATTAAHLCGQPLPGDARPQDEDDSAKGCPIRHARTAAPRLWRLRWDQLLYEAPQLVTDRFFAHGRPTIFGLPQVLLGAVNTTDVTDLEHNYLLLAQYRQQAEDLNPPEEYKYQYGAFSSGIAELYNAAWIAYMVAADPVSATKEDLWAYRDHLVYATNLLAQSDRSLGQNYKTTEGLEVPTGGTLQPI